MTCNILVWLHILAGLLHEFLSFESRQALQAPSKEGVTSNEHLVRKLLNHRYTWRYIFPVPVVFTFRLGPAVSQASDTPPAENSVQSQLSNISNKMFSRFKQAVANVQGDDGE